MNNEENNNHELEAEKQQSSETEERAIANTTDPVHAEFAAELTSRNDRAANNAVEQSAETEQNASQKAEQNASENAGAEQNAEDAGQETQTNSFDANSEAEIPSQWTAKEPAPNLLANNDPYNEQDDAKVNEEFDEEFNEEFAAETAVNRPDVAPMVRNNERPAIGRAAAKEGADEQDRTFGWVSLIAAIASLFIWPVVLGPAAAIMGFIAYNKGSRTLGVWSIVIGLLAFIAYLFIVPYYT